MQLETQWAVKASAEDKLETPVEIGSPSKNPSNINANINTGQLIVIAGPSGVGKGTLLKHFLEGHRDLQVSISATTRQPRPGEVNGQHYYFLSKQQFDAMIADNALLEWAEFAGNCYGTPKAPIISAIAQGKRVILEIELIGARQVRKSFPQAKQIFVLPPSRDILEKRIRRRGQDSEEAIAKRLSQAEVELAAADEFDVQIVNDSLERAIAELERVIFADAITADAKTQSPDSEP
ncbi:MAG: guanylate kinase [Phormidesmis sp. RL_2_1]|nr:guanylate kinase [Phormidesmis sp. RL_2_1]